MVRFYDPKDEAEQAVVEQILNTEGIEYFLVDQNEAGLGPKQIMVAEEDVPRAKELLYKGETTTGL